MKGKANPIKSHADIQRIREVLKDKPRDLLLFDLATQTGMEIKQILNLRVRDLFGCKVGDRLVLPHPGGKPPSVVVVSKTLHQSWGKYLRDVTPSHDEYLIKSQKNSGPPTLSSISHMMNKWFEAANLEGLNGAKSLRRTWQVFFKSGFPERSPRQDINNRIPPYGYLQALEPIETISTLQETVHEKLFQAIICGRIPPGEKLVIDKIAMQMKVSRIPVREAFHRLQEAGLISIDKWKGAMVNKLSVENLREITVIRLMLESEAAERAAENFHQAVLDQLENLHGQWKRSISLLNKNDLQSVEKYLRLNRRFHHTIYHEAHMPILQQIINGLWVLGGRRL